MDLGGFLYGWTCIYTFWIFQKFWWSCASSLGWSHGRDGELGDVLFLGLKRSLITSRQRLESRHNHFQSQISDRVCDRYSVTQSQLREFFWHPRVGLTVIQTRSCPTKTRFLLVKFTLKALMTISISKSSLCGFPFDLILIPLLWSNVGAASRAGNGLGRRRPYSKASTLGDSHY